jgi:hypothetical protein
MEMHHMILLCHSDTDLQRLILLFTELLTESILLLLLEFKNIYENHHGLESVFAQNKESATMQKKHHRI